MTTVPAVDVLESKPTLRGVLHHWAALVALGAGLVLVALSPSARVMGASAGYALSVVFLYTVSATYHRPTWGPSARARMRSLDHSAIFVLIAGTYTPICVIGIPGAAGARLLAMVWIGAAIGVAKSLFWAGSPKVVTAALALALGWVVVPYLGAVRDALSSAELALLFGGGVAYSLGAVAYATKRPNPAPGHFGYHEVFHALTIVAGVMHYALVLSLVRAAGR
jgi:hemolysin III